jgi:hypothetical protein
MAADVSRRGEAESEKVDIPESLTRLGARVREAERFLGAQPGERARGGCIRT